MQDPFPDNILEDDKVLQKSLPIDYTNLVYHKSKYIKGNSPKCMYFPSRYIMFKLIRACVDVYTIKELWFCYDDVK